MKILSMTSGFDGCGYYRIQLPAKYINRAPDHHQKISFTYDNHDIDWCDVMVIQKQYQQEVQGFVKYAIETGKPVLYECDDLYFAIPKTNPAYKVYDDSIQNMLKVYYKTVSGMTVSTAHLRDQLLPYNDNIHILPNSIDFNEVDKIEKSDPKKLRKLVKFLNKDKKRIDVDKVFESIKGKTVIAWGGSPTHLDDLEIITNTLKKIAEENDDVVIMMIACCTDTLLKSLPVPEKLLLVEPVKVFSYNKLLNILPADIFLAPIVDCSFNLSKSNLKTIESFAHRKAIVASNVGDYSTTIEDGVNGFLCSNDKDKNGIATEWYDKITELVKNKFLREKFVSNGYDFSRENYNITKNYQLWLDAYGSYL